MEAGESMGRANREAQTSREFVAPCRRLELAHGDFGSSFA